MPTKVLLVVPEAPAAQATAEVAERRIEARGIRLGVLDNSKGNADHLLQFMLERVRAEVQIESVVLLRKPTVNEPAPGALLDQLAREADIVVTAMAD